MKREFELWLDESGNFTNDAKTARRGFNPSLVGGILVEKRQGKNFFSQKRIEEVIPEDYSHGNEESRDETYGKFQKIVSTCEKIEKEGGFARLVVFSNEECIMVIDNNLTYQNIMAEGLKQTIEWLKSQFQDIKLHVVIARRVVIPDEETDSGRGRRKRTDSPDHRKTGRGQETVSAEEYKRRLEEKLILAGYQGSIQDDDWELEIQSAREGKDKRLMIADNICNAFLTRKTKFKDERYKAVRETYENPDRTKRYSAFSNSLLSGFRQMLSANRLGEAVIKICQCNPEKEKEMIEECMAEAGRRLKNMRDIDIKFHYGFIQSFFDYCTNIEHNYAASERLLKNLIKYFLPVLEQRSEKKDVPLIVRRISFDLKFYLLTIFTHRGNIEDALECERQCDQEIQALRENTWDDINLGIKYRNRKIISEINRYDFENALETCSKLVEQCEEIKELLGLHSEDARYEELGKALGTRVQVYTFLLRKHPQYYNDAVRDSDAAMKEFVMEADLARQYTYRVQMETEKGKYDEALAYLRRVYQIPEGAPIVEFKKRLQESRNPFSLCMYVRLMAEGALAGWSQADDMYEVLNQTGVMDDLKKNYRQQSQEHPLEIIFWKYASYLAKKGRHKGAKEYYDAAVGICFPGAEQAQPALQIIGLAIVSECYAMSLKEDWKEKSDYRKVLKKCYDMAYSRKLPESARGIFEGLSFEEKNWGYYYEKSRNVTY